jgi:hypothetical protein
MDQAASFRDFGEKLGEYGYVMDILLLLDAGCVSRQQQSLLQLHGRRGNTTPLCYSFCVTVTLYNQRQNM